MSKKKRNLEDNYNAYNPAPFVNASPAFQYYTDNINPILVNSETGEVKQEGKQAGTIMLDDVIVKGNALKAKELIQSLPKEKGLENPMIDPLTMIIGGGRYTGDIIGDITGELLGRGVSKLSAPAIAYGKRKLSDFGQYSREHVYANIAPVGYDHIWSRINAATKGIMSGKRADIENPKWLDKVKWKEAAHDYEVPEEYFRQARIDAWRLHNKLPQKYNTFVPSLLEVGAYQPNLKAALDNPNFSSSLKTQLLKNFLHNTSGGIDIVNGAGGNVGKYEIKNFFGIIDDYNKPYSGRITYKDVWDLHPFSRPNDAFTNKIIRPFTTKVAHNLARKVKTKADNIAEFLQTDFSKTRKFHKDLKAGDKDALDVANDGVTNILLSNENALRFKVGNKISRLGNRVYGNIHQGEFKLTNNKLTKAIDKKFKNLEVGDVTGGKPFKVITDFPVYRTTEPGIVRNNDGEFIMFTVPDFKIGFNPESILTDEQKRYKQLFELYHK